MEYEARFTRAFEFLLENPAVGSMARYRGRVYRRWSVGGHIVVFRQTIEMLVIVRVMHGASDHRLYSNR
jgi:plasmid stabilization system protein ParE